MDEFQWWPSGTAAVTKAATIMTAGTRSDSSYNNDISYISYINYINDSSNYSCKL